MPTTFPSSVSRGKILWFWSSDRKMFLSIEDSAGLVERECDTGEFAREDDDRLGGLQTACAQLPIQGLEYFAIGGSHTGVVEQAAQQRRSVFGQRAPAATSSRVVGTRIQPCVGDERAGARKTQRAEHRHQLGRHYRADADNARQALV